MRPIIGLTHSIELDEVRLYANLSYPNAIIAAGGTPLLLPATTDESILRQYVQTVDGLLLSGGDDIDPQYYGETQLWQCGEISALRDCYELTLTRLAIEMGKPILGICRGIQLLNVALGGTLYQDLQSQQPDSLCHGQKQKSCYPSHTVAIVSGSRLHGLFGDDLAVNSHHHQAVKALGDGLVITATAADGVIEAVERPGLSYCVAVQWHPERLVEKQENAAHRALFDDFVNVCRK